MSLHPDKKGEAFIDIFKDITLAFRMISIFLADYADHQEATGGSTNPEDDQALLDLLESKNRLKYNRESVTMAIAIGTGEAWIAAMEKKLEVARESIVDKEKRTIGYKIKNDKVKIPYTGFEVSVTVSIWPSPGDGVPKILVQGRGYWAFVMCILPNIIRSMKQIKSALTVQTPQITQTASQIHTTSSQQQTPITDNQHQTTTQPQPSPSPQPVAVTAKLSEAIVKIEKAVIDLGSSMNERLTSIENEVRDVRNNCPNNQTITKLSNSVTALAGSLSDSVKEIQTSCQSVSDITVTMSDTDLASLSVKVTDHVVPRLTETLNENFTVIDKKVETLKESIKSVEGELKGAGTEVKDLAKNLAGLPTLVASLQGMVNTPGAKISNPASKSQAPVGPNVQETTKDPPQGPKTRKGVIFTSSLAKQSDLKKLERELNCKLELHVTYYIKETSNGSTEDDSLTKKTADVMSKCLNIIGNNKSLNWLHLTHK